jgi:ribonuclease R
MVSYPDREQILEAIKHAHQSTLSLDALMRVFALPPAKRKGFERLLDNLTLEGGLEGHDGGYTTPADTKAKGKSAPASKRPSLPPSKAGKVGVSDAAPKSKKGLPDTFKRAKPVVERIEARPIKSEKRKRDDANDAPMPKFTEAAERLGTSRPGQKSQGGREGVIGVNARGFGFVVTPGEEDVFIGEGGLRGAMHGDKVRINIINKTARGLEGVVTEIVTRGRVRISGILRRKGKSAWLEPDDTRVRGPIELPDALDNKGQEGNSGTDGDVCIVQVTRYPEHPNENPEGKILQVLGRPGVLSVEAQKLIAVAGIQETHSDEAIAESETFGLEVPVAMLEGREDLTHVPLPTIDPEDARDHDDAVWVERTKTGYRAWIAIADVSSYVTPGTKLDEEARTRGCSVYLPDRAIPMLPRALSSNLCSLLPDVTRLCLCVVADLDSDANLTSFRLVRGFMKSAAKLTYGGVARALGFTELPPVEPKAEAMIEGLKVANELSKALRAKRMARGALDFDLPEPKIIWDANKMPIDVTKRSQDGGVKKAYQLIEELMLLGNEVVAKWLVEKNIPSIFRVHLPPDEKKLMKLEAMCEILGVEFSMEETRDAKSLSAVVKRFNQHEKANILHMLLLRSMKQAVYEPANKGHFGLASEAYLHFTSPIRRYPDLVVHRAVHRECLKQPPIKSDSAMEALTEAAVLASQAERRAMEVERDIVDLYRCFVMKEHIGDTYTGAVTSLVGSGAYVALETVLSDDPKAEPKPAPFVDVMLRFDNMGTEMLELDDDGLRATAPGSGLTLSIGDKVNVRILDVSIERRQTLAIWLDAPVGTAQKRSSKREGGSSDRSGGGKPGRSGSGGGSSSRSGPSRGGASNKKGGGAGRDPRAKAESKLLKLEHASRKGKSKVKKQKPKRRK